LVAKPCEVIDLTKDEEHVDKVVVPIINQTVTKEECPTDPMGEKKVETKDENSEHETQSDEEDTFKTHNEQD
jgi:hypothetical protein